VAAVGSAILLGSVVWLGPLSLEARAAVTTNLDQWASTDFAWQNGNLNGNNSRYPEGGIVPFRLALEGLVPGNHEIVISYDFTAGGHKAYDFLATWNATNGAGSICSPSGGAISSMCPSMPLASERTFPIDPYVTDGLSVAGAQSYAKMPRTLRLWGGTITSIGAPVHSGSTSGNSEVEMVVRFKAIGPAVLLAWGGHLAQSRYWNRADGGEADGASLVSGAPWHVRTTGLDGAGNKNQDRSIQPSAIVGELIPPGDPPPAAQPPATPRPPAQPPGVPVVTGPRPTPPNTASGSEAAAAAASPPGLVMFALSGLLFVAWMAKVLVGRSRKP
jgi:hypothetical protein